MSATIGTKGVRVVPVAQGVIQLDGTEQTVFRWDGRGSPIGYLDMSQMSSGDRIVVREYISLGPGSGFLKYHQEAYTGPQENPVLYIHPRRSEYGIMITVQRELGSFQMLGFLFLLEV